MPKERRVNSPSFDCAAMSPYSCGLKISDHSICDSSLPHDGDEKEWEDTRCPICMEHPHNAVLLRCSSQEKGCRPFICDTSYRHSNCLDQFRKSAAASSLQNPSVEQQSELVCPLCRGAITGWDVVQPARKFMDSKTRSCTLETCGFIGNYSELRKHARLKHPSERPSEASPTQKSNWAALERQRDIEDALAHQLNTENSLDEWPILEQWDDGLWSGESFLEFPTMSDIDETLLDEILGGISVSLFSFYSPSPEEEMVDSVSSRNGDRHRLHLTALSTNSGSTSNNRAGNILPTSVSRPYHSENGTNISGSRSRYQRERSSDHRQNSSTFSSPIWSHHTENGLTSSRARPSYHRENGSNLSRSRSSDHRENAPSSSRSGSSYRREYVEPGSRYHHREAAPSVRQSAARRHLPGSSRRPHSSFRRHEQ